MMKQTMDAVFEKGVFRPVVPDDLPLADGQHVRLTVEVGDAEPEPLALALKVYDGLSDADVAEIERIALNRQDFFGDRAPQ